MRNVIRFVRSRSPVAYLGSSRRVLLDQLVACGTQLQEALGLFVQALPLMTIEGGPLQNAEYSLGTEVVLVIEEVHCPKHFVGKETRILDVCELVSPVVDHLAARDHEAILDDVVVKFSTRVGMGDGNLYGLDVEPLRKGDCVVDGFASFAGSPRMKSPWITRPSW